MEYSDSFFAPSVAQLKAEHAPSPSRRKSTAVDIAYDIDSDANGASSTLASTFHSADACAADQPELSRRSPVVRAPGRRLCTPPAGPHGDFLPATANAICPMPPAKDTRRCAAGHPAEGPQSPREWYSCIYDLNTEAGPPMAGQNGSPTLCLNDGGVSFEPHPPAAPARGAPRPSAWRRGPLVMAPACPRAATPQAPPRAEPPVNLRENLTQQFFRLALMRKEERLRQSRMVHGRVPHTHRAHTGEINGPRRVPLPEGPPQRWQARGHSVGTPISAMQLRGFPTAHAVPRAPSRRDDDSAAGPALDDGGSAAPLSGLSSAASESLPDQFLLHHETPLDPSMVSPMSANRRAAAQHEGPVESVEEVHQRDGARWQRQQVQERPGLRRRDGFTYSGLISQMVRDASTSDSDTDGDDDDVQVAVPMAELPPEQREWMGVCPARDFKHVRSPNWSALPVPEDEMEFFEAELSPASVSRDQSRGTAARPTDDSHQRRVYAADEVKGADEASLGARYPTTEPPLEESTTPYSPLQPPCKESAVAPLELGGLPHPTSPVHARSRAGSIGGYSFAAPMTAWGIGNAPDDGDDDDGAQSLPQSEHRLHRRAQKKAPGGVYASAFAPFRRPSDSNSVTSGDSQEMSKSDTGSLHSRAPPSAWQSTALSIQQCLTSAFVPPQEEPCSRYTSVPTDAPPPPSQNVIARRSPAALMSPAAPRYPAMRRFFGRFANMKFMRRKVPLGEPNSLFKSFQLD